MLLALEDCNLREGMISDLVRNILSLFEKPVQPGPEVPKLPKGPRWCPPNMYERAMSQSALVD